MTGHKVGNTVSGRLAHRVKQWHAGAATVAGEAAVHSI